MDAKYTVVLLHNGVGRVARELDREAVLKLLTEEEEWEEIGIMKLGVQTSTTNRGKR